MRKWLLPEYIEDVLPEPARRVESLRRGMLDLFATHGYQLVIPPLLEYVESLLTGTGHDLDLRTFKLVDQLSGRTLGVRADITPQVARIDAHLMNRKGVNRFTWTMRHPNATTFANMITWAGSGTGPSMAPGTYRVVLTVGSSARRTLANAVANFGNVRCARRSMAAAECSLA